MTDAVCIEFQNSDTPSRAPVDVPETYAVLWNRDAATEALNDRRLELGFSMRELDDAAEQAAGTTAKYLGPSQLKSLGMESFFKLASAVGLRVVFEVDPKATAKLLTQRRPRQAKQARVGNHSQRVSDRVVTRALRHLAVLSWQDAVSAVAEVRAAVKAAEAAKAEKDKAAEGKAKGPTAPASAAAATATAWDRPMSELSVSASR